MTAEREQLNKTLEAVAQKMDEANNSLWEKEIALQKKMDQVGTWPTPLVYHSFLILVRAVGEVHSRIQRFCVQTRSTGS